MAEAELRLPMPTLELLLRANAPTPEAFSAFSSKRLLISPKVSPFEASKDVDPKVWPGDIIWSLELSAGSGGVASFSSI